MVRTLQNLGRRGQGEIAEGLCSRRPPVIQNKKQAAVLRKEEEKTAEEADKNPIVPGVTAGQLRRLMVH